MDEREARGQPPARAAYLYAGMVFTMQKPRTHGALVCECANQRHDFGQLGLSDEFTGEPRIGDCGDVECSEPLGLDAARK